jgi:hypothetical protein
MIDNRRKKLASFVALLALLAVFGCSCACSTDSLEQTTNDDGTLSLQPLTTIVCDRHDEYVKADAALDADGKAAALAESYLVRQAFLSESVAVAPISAPMKAVLTRHDAYVNADTTLKPTARKLALYSSANIRRTFAEAAGGGDEGTASKPTGSG